MRGIPANTSSAGQDRDLHALEVTGQDSGETIMTINDELTDEILRCWMSDFVFFFFFFLLLEFAPTSESIQIAMTQ